MMFSAVLLAVAWVCIIYLWEEDRNEEKTRQFEEEIAKIDAEIMREVYYVNRSTERGYYDNGNRRHSKCS